MKKNRIEYLDMSKGIAILLVVIGHIYHNNYFKIWIFSFHMPLFFIISGCLYNYNEIREYSIKELILKNLRRLIVPYIIFSLVHILFNGLINGFSINNTIWQLIYIVVLQGVGALWFLPALFITEILFSISYKLLKEDIKIIICNIIIFGLAIYISKIEYNIIQLIIARSCVGAFFYCIGYYIFNIVIRKSLSIKIIGTMFVINIILSYINGKVGLYVLEFKNIIWYVVCSVLGTLSIIFFFKKFNVESLSYFSKNSLIIMATHEILISIIHKFIKFNFNKYSIGIIVFIIVMLLEIPIIKLINERLSWIIGKYK